MPRRTPGKGRHDARLASSIPLSCAQRVRARRLGHAGSRGFPHAHRIRHRGSRCSTGRSCPRRYAGAPAPLGNPLLNVFAFLTAAAALLSRSALLQARPLRLPLGAAGGLTLLGVVQLLPLPEGVMQKIASVNLQIYHETAQILRLFGSPRTPRPAFRSPRGKRFRPSWPGFPACPFSSQQPPSRDPALGAASSAGSSWCRPDLQLLRLAALRVRGGRAGASAPIGTSRPPRPDGSASPSALSSE